MAQFGGKHLGDGFYEQPHWWPEYLRLELEATEQGEGINSRDLWAHVLEHWHTYVLPDLQRFYPRLPGEDETTLMALPWRALREVILSLFNIRESITGATFAHQHAPKEET